MEPSARRPRRFPVIAAIFLVVALVAFSLRTFSGIHRADALRESRNPVRPAAVEGEHLPKVLAPAAGPDPEGSADDLVARLKDSGRPIQGRLEEIGNLGKRGDPQAVAALMALGRQRTFVRSAAVEALGGIHTPEVGDYLRKALFDPDSRMVCAALRTLARQGDPASIPDIAQAMERNRTRPDGHETLVLTAAVQALAQIGPDKAMSILTSELGRAEEKGWDLEYGSQVVDALRHSAAARTALLAYADLLTVRMPAVGEPREYFQKKINEVRAAAR
jgi:hypothetical protein